MVWREGGLNAGVCFGMGLFDVFGGVETRGGSLNTGDVWSAFAFGFGVVFLETGVDCRLGGLEDTIIGGA